jgi:SAM-dependent methyltransferase
MKRTHELRKTVDGKGHSFHEKESRAMTTEAEILERINVLRHGYWRSSVLFAGVELGVFAALRKGPMTAEDLRAELGCDSRGMLILCRALAGLELLVADGDKFTAEPAALAALAPDGAHDQTAMIRHVANLVPSWARLAECVRAGAPANRLPSPVHADHQGWSDAEFRVFIRAMHQAAAPLAASFVAMPETRAARRMLDVGGGPGSYDIAFVRRGDDLRATILDRPGALAVARELAREAGVEDRIEFREGDALADSFGDGFDLVLMSQLLHAFGPEECRAVIANGAAALAPGGVLAINEFALEDDGVSPAPAAIFGANMLVGTDRGQTYKASELADWMRQSGLCPLSPRSLNGHSTLVFGKKE